MAWGVHGRNILLRLGKPDREAIAAAHDQVGLFKPMGRPMKEYVALPEGLDLPARELADWVGRSFAFCGVASSQGEEALETASRRRVTASVDVTVSADVR